MRKKLSDTPQNREPKQMAWVKASYIIKVTGWDAEGMRRARLSGAIRYKKSNGFWYDLESLHPLLMIKTA